TELILHRKFVDLDYDAIDFIRQFFTLGIPRFTIFQNAIQGRTHFPLRAYFEAKRTQRCECFRMPLELLATVLGRFCKQIVSVEIQSSLCRDLRIEHSHCSRRRISRVHENLSAFQFLSTVQRFKGFAWHDDFATHLEITTHSKLPEHSRIDTQWNGADRAHIWRHILAGGSVTARHSTR